MKVKTGNISVVVILTGLISILISSKGNAQYQFDKSDVFKYQKREFNLGLNFKSANERDVLNTDESFYNEELRNNIVSFGLNSRFWNLVDNKQERFDFKIDLGPLWGKGNWIDSTKVADIEADHKIAGLRAAASVDYSYRYYYNSRNYTMLKISGWARYDWFHQNSEGISADSNMVVSDYVESSNETKYIAGIDGRAGWGIGRLNAMNHFMVAEYILKECYPEKTFSQQEIMLLANEIEMIKSNRSGNSTGRNEVEADKIQQYLNQKMFLLKKNNWQNDWHLGEFLPRYNGTRLEFGPFFQYYNQEPDFIYGGYVLFDHAKYCNLKWNRHFSAGVNYNAYKKNDWILGEFSMGWSYFMKLKSKFDFGLTYVPGIEINQFENIGTFNHGFIPYVGWFTQLNAKNRIDLKFSMRFSEDEKLMQSGPEFSVSFYRSRY